MGLEHRYEQTITDAEATPCPIGTTIAATYQWLLGQTVHRYTLYDTTAGSLPEERRVVLDLLDVRTALEQVGDALRWSFAEHTLVDSLTTRMPTHLLTFYVRYMTCALSYGHQLKDTQRVMAKLCKLALSHNTDLQGRHRTQAHPAKCVRNAPTNLDTARTHASGNNCLCSCMGS